MNHGALVVRMRFEPGGSAHDRGSAGIGYSIHILEGDMELLGRGIALHRADTGPYRGYHSSRSGRSLPAQSFSSGTSDVSILMSTFLWFLLSFRSRAATDISGNNATVRQSAVNENPLVHMSSAPIVFNPSTAPRCVTWGKLHPCRSIYCDIKCPWALTKPLQYCIIVLIHRPLTWL